MLWFVIAIIAAIVIYKVFKKKREEEQRRQKFEAERQREEALKEKAQNGDLSAQVELSKFYYNKMSNYYSDYNLESKLYWDWVAVYNGFDSSLVGQIADIIDRNLSTVNGISDDISRKAALNTLKYLKKAEGRAYRDRTLLKNMFPSDVGDIPEVKKLHDEIQNLPY